MISQAVAFRSRRTKPTRAGSSTSGGGGNDAEEVKVVRGRVVNKVLHFISVAYLFLLQALVLCRDKMALLCL